MYLKVRFYGYLFGVDNKSRRDNFLKIVYNLY